MTLEIPKALLQALSSYAQHSEPSLRDLYALGRYIVDRNIPGDYVECGVARGGSAATVGAALNGSGRQLWLYDSFQGLPVSIEADGAYAGQLIGAFSATEQDVHDALAVGGVDLTSVRIIPGWFQETLVTGSPGPELISFLHVDADLYDSTLLSLTRFYNQIVRGGIILLDDFGWFEGTRRAFYDFIAERQISPLIERFSKSQLYWIKGKEHNRDRADDPPLEALLPYGRHKYGEATSASR